MALSKNAQAVKAVLLKDHAEVVKGVPDRCLNDAIRLSLELTGTRDYMFQSDYTRYAKEAAELIEAGKKG